MRRVPEAKQRPQRGVVLIWLAFFMVFMLGFVALGIDAAKMMATRTQLQNAADAAALAGASALDLTTGKLMPDTSLARAQFNAAQNVAFTSGPTPIVLLAGDVTFPAQNEIQVIVRRNPAAGGSMITHVAQVLGITSLDLSASATAIAESSGTVCEGLVPMAPVEDPVIPFQTGCSHTYSLKVGAGGNTPGNFQLLDFPNCDEGPCANVGGGAAQIRCEVANGYSCCIDIGDMVPTQPGNKVGPFSQGLNDRWSRDTDQRVGICYEDYKGNGQRVVLVPKIQTFDVSGKKPVKITGFSAFFLQTKPTGGGSQTLIGQFLYTVVPGSGGGGHGTLFSIRLIK